MTPRATLIVAGLVAMSSLACPTGDNGSRPEREAPTTTRLTPARFKAPKGCSRARVPLKRRDVRAVAFARGDGPVYAGLGTADLVRYTQDTREHEGWYYYKTLWAIAPDYGGEVTITGHQVDGPNELLFNAGSGFPGEKSTDLHFSDSGGSEWRYGPSEILIRADGCYALRIVGDDFTEWVTFIARA